MNIDQIKQTACKVLAVCDLIERSKKKEAVIYNGAWYVVFGDKIQRNLDVKAQRKVTQRLYGYLEGLTS